MYREVQRSTQLESLNFDDLIVWHAAWKQWRNVRRELYRLMGSDNIESVIKAIREAPGFFEILKDIVKVSGKDIEEVEHMARDGVEIIPITDERYPEELLKMQRQNELIYPPLVLYAKGAVTNLNKLTMIAVVGTRTPTEKGRETAREIGRRLAEKGLTLVTGFAKGVDAAVTEGVKEGGGVAVEVRPWLNPLEIPCECRYLLSYVLRKGCIVSENWAKRGPQSWIKMQYFLRNRLIAGMAKAVVVVEAREGGGSMHQVEFALKRGKPTFIWRTTGTDEGIKRGFKKYTSLGATLFNDVNELMKALAEHLKA